MRSLSEVESWEAVSKKVYWDREIPLEKWSERVSTGHRSYLPDAVAGMDVLEFVHFYGVKHFIHDWPLLRPLVPKNIVRKVYVYDLAWSKLAGGGWNLRPTSDFNAMPERRRQFLTEVSKIPGRSIYAVAKSLGMQYRRAYEHSVNLIQTGKIRGKEVLEGGHRKTKLYPTYEKQY